jgi:hypothetical protein
VSGKNVFVGSQNQGELSKKTSLAVGVLMNQLTKIIGAPEAVVAPRINEIRNDIIARRPVVSFRKFDRM